MKFEDSNGGFLITDEVCKGIVCGKGTCKPSTSSAFFFECQCDSGWKRTSSENSDHYKFLPCVIPNCMASLSFSFSNSYTNRLWSITVSLDTSNISQKQYLPCKIYILLSEEHLFFYDSCEAVTVTDAENLNVQS